MARLSSEGGERGGAHLFDLLFAFSAVPRQQSRHLLLRARRRNCTKVHNSERTEGFSCSTGKLSRQTHESDIRSRPAFTLEVPNLSTAERSATLPARRSHSLCLPRHHRIRPSRLVGAAKALLLLLLLLHIQPSSPSNIGLDLVQVLRRKLLQATKTFTTLTPDDTHLKLCETDVCDSRRPDGPGNEGLCDRWARGDECPSEQIFRVNGDPGANDKAEMFFNLRSPWNVSCDKGTCRPSTGAVYDVFVAEGCIPQRDYISEMQDTSDRVSKQVKIYLRRKAEFYITVQRRPGVSPSAASNCSFGMTVGAIEAKSDTAQCFNFRRIERGEAIAANVPDCKEVMPQYESFQQPDTSAQATFVVALIGLGILVLALLVLGGVLLRRWSRRKARKAKDLDLDFGGVNPGASDTLALQEAAADRPSPDSAAGDQGAVVVDVEPAEARDEDEPRRKQRQARTREDRQRLERRIMQIEDGVDDEGEDEGELGANAGVLQGRSSAATMQLKQGRGGSKLVMGSVRSSKNGASSSASDRPGSGSSGSGSGGRSSPADELYRSRLTGRKLPGSPGGSRVPTPPEGAQGPRGAAPRRMPGSRGSAVAGEDIDLSVKRRPDTASSAGSAVEMDDTGIRIDDILAQARGAAAAAAAGKMTPDRSRAWKAGDRSPAPSGSGSSGAKADGSGSSSSREGSSVGGASREPAPPAPSATAGADGRPARPPVMAPLMAARLGIKPQQAIGGRTMAPLGSKPTQATSPDKTEPSPTTAKRTVMLQSIAPRAVANLPVAGTAGVPLPPPRNGAMLPPSRALPGNGNGMARQGETEAQRASEAGPTGLPPVGGNAPAWRTPTGTPEAGAQRPPLGAMSALPGQGAGANGRDGRGMNRISVGNGRGRDRDRGAPHEHVLEESD